MMKTKRRKLLILACILVCLFMYWPTYGRLKSYIGKTETELYWRFGPPWPWNVMYVKTCAPPPETIGDKAQVDEWNEQTPVRILVYGADVEVGINVHGRVASVQYGSSGIAEWCKALSL